MTRQFLDVCTVCHTKGLIKKGILEFWIGKFRNFPIQNSKIPLSGILLFLFRSCFLFGRCFFFLALFFLFGSCLLFSGFFFFRCGFLCSRLRRLFFLSLFLLLRSSFLLFLYRFFFPFNPN